MPDDLVPAIDGFCFEPEPVPDGFSPAIDQFCSEAQQVPVDVLATVAGDLAGSPLEDLAGAVHRLARLSAPGRPHGVARLLLIRAVVITASCLDDAEVEQMAGSRDRLWRAAGEAINIVRRSARHPDSKGAR